MNSLINFFKESWAELRQVAWLTVPQMVASTWIVIILVVIMAIYLGGVDFVIARVIGALV
jgi:preprotein translocase subunit SecE